MIDKIKSFFNRLDDTICYIKSGDYEKDHSKVDGKIHFIDHTLFIAPKTRVSTCGMLINWKKTLFSDLKNISTRKFTSLLQTFGWKNLGFSATDSSRGTRK